MLLLMSYQSLCAGLDLLEEVETLDGMPTPFKLWNS